MGIGLFDERVPASAVQQIVAADTTTLKAFTWTPGGQLVRIDNLLLTNSDSIDHKVVVWWTISAVNYVIGSVDVPAGSGHAGTPSVDAIPLLIPAGQQGLHYSNFATISVSVEVTVTSGSVQAVAIGGTL